LRKKLNGQKKKTANRYNKAQQFYYHSSVEFSGLTKQHECREMCVERSLISIEYHRLASIGFLTTEGATPEK
jgi:hypothetical protein